MNGISTIYTSRFPFKVKVLLGFCGIKQEWDEERLRQTIQELESEGLIRKQGSGYVATPLGHSVKDMIFESCALSDEETARNTAFSIYKHVTRNG